MKLVNATWLILCAWLFLNTQCRAQEAVNKTVEQKEYIIYKVQKSEGLFSIARKYGISPADIRRLNPGLSDALRAGDVLKIPLKSFETIGGSTSNTRRTHIVASGEYLFSIARKYNIPVAELLKANPGLDGSTLKAGMSIIIPNVGGGDQSPSPVQPNELNSDGTYTLQLGQTLYSVARSFNVSLNELLSVNNITDVTSVGAGTVLRIPGREKAGVVTRNNTVPQLVVYKTSGRERITDIALKYGLRAEVVVSLNPGFSSVEPLSQGTEIKLPVGARLSPQMTDAPTLTPSVPEQIKPVHQPGVQNQPLSACKGRTYNEVINVAIVWPLFLDSVAELMINKTDENGIAYQMAKSKVLYPAKGVFREFLEGSLLALDSLNDIGVRIKYHIYDSKADSGVVKQLMMKPEMTSMNLIIGPAMASSIPVVSRFSKNNKIPMVVPYVADANVTDGNPYCFQVNPTREVLYKPAAEWVANHCADKNIVMVQSDKADDRQKQFTKLFKQSLYKARSGQHKTAAYSEVTFNSKRLIDVTNLIKKDEDNLIIIPCEKDEVISMVLATLENLKGKKGYERISVFGFPEYLKKEGREQEMLFPLESTIYTPFYIEDSSDVAMSFYQQYRTWFGNEPSSGLYYSTLGFDVTYFFGSAIHYFGPEFSDCIATYNPRLVTSKFKFVKKGGYSGFVNEHVFILQ